MLNRPFVQILNSLAAELRYLIVAGLLLLPVMPAAAATFGEVASWCAPPDAGGRPTLCSGYLETEIQCLASTDPSLHGGVRVCVPEIEDRNKLRQLMRAYARDNPSSRDLPGVVGLGQALKDLYPCR
jgi:Rap1a immunity proteins